MSSIFNCVFTFDGLFFIIIVVNEFTDVFYPAYAVYEYEVYLSEFRDVAFYGITLHSLLLKS